MDEEYVVISGYNCMKCITTTTMCFCCGSNVNPIHGSVPMFAFFLKSDACEKIRIPFAREGRSRDPNTDLKMKMSVGSSVR